MNVRALPAIAFRTAWQNLVSFPLEGSAGKPRFILTVWFVTPSYLIPTRSGFTNSAKDE